MRGPGSQPRQLVKKLLFSISENGSGGINLSLLPADLHPKIKIQLIVIITFVTNQLYFF